MVFTGFHGSVIKLQGQNSEVLRILIYTRLKINKKISLWTSFLPRSLFPFENRAIWTSSFSQCETPILNRIAVALRKSREKVSSLDFQQSTVKPRGASLQRIPGTKVLAWDQAGSDQAPNGGRGGGGGRRKKNPRDRKKKKAKEGSRQLGLLFFISPSFCLFPSMRSLVPGCYSSASYSQTSFLFTHTYIFYWPDPTGLCRVNVTAVINTEIS